MDEYISTQEAQNILGIDADVMLDLISDGKIRNRRIDGENRVLAADVDSYRQELATAHASETVDAITVTPMEPMGTDSGAGASTEGTSELETLELMDDVDMEPPSAATVVLTDTQSGSEDVDVGQSTPASISTSTEMLAGVTDAAAGGAAADNANAHTSTPLRTEELFFEDDDLGLEEGASKTQDVTVVEEAVTPVRTPTAPTAHGGSVTEELAPEDLVDQPTSARTGTVAHGNCL